MGPKMLLSFIENIYIIFFSVITYRFLSIDFSLLECSLWCAGLYQPYWYFGFFNHFCMEMKITKKTPINFSLNKEHQFLWVECGQVGSSSLTKCANKKNLGKKLICFKLISNLQVILLPLSQNNFNLLLKTISNSSPLRLSMSCFVASYLAQGLNWGEKTAIVRQIE